MTNNENRTQAVREALNEVFATKAPTKRAAVVAGYLVVLPTTAEVYDFTDELRRRAGVQDVALLPSTTWLVKRWEGGKLGNDATIVAGRVDMWDGVESLRIDWPSVTFHWGVRVEFTKNGNDFVAYSADYTMTETYLSS